MKFDKRDLLLSILFLSSMLMVKAQNKTFEPGSFSEVVISPHIEVVFEKADHQHVVIEDIDVPLEKLTVEVKGKSLQIYLEGAKVYTKSEKVDDDHHKREELYSGTVVTARVYFQELEDISLRGEENHRFNSLIQGDELRLKIYGESRVHFKELQLNSFITTIYGEAYLEVKKGESEKQKVISYGESEFNSLGLLSKKCKVTAYGEGVIQLNVEDELKVTAYGEAEISYKGSPMVSKGIVIGEAEVRQLD